MIFDGGKIGLINRRFQTTDFIRGLRSGVRLYRFPHQTAERGITEQKPSVLAKLKRGKSQAELESHSFRVLGDYLQILQDWKAHCAPQSPEDAIDPRYAEACHMLERIGNMLDILACGTPQERAEVVADLQKDDRLMRMEARNRQIREDEHGTK